MKRTDHVDLSVIVPVLNEEAVVEQTITDLKKKLTPLSRRLQIVAVDDGSTDQTSRILDSLARSDKRISVARHPTNFGYGAALRTGLTKTRFPWVFFTDADLQFNAVELRHLFPYRFSYDFIVGFRRKRADSLKRVIISAVYNRLIRFLFGLPLRDVDCAFKLMRRSALLRIPFYSNSFFMSVELMVKARKKGYRIKELGVSHYPRRRGESKVTPRRILFTIIDLVRLYRRLHL